jgi:hypothetical protein
MAPCLIETFDSAVPSRGMYPCIARIRRGHTYPFADLEQLPELVLFRKPGLRGSQDI